MFYTVLIMMNIASIIPIVAYGYFYSRFFVNKGYGSKTVAYHNCKKFMLISEIVSIVFMVLSWLAASILPTEECLKLYQMFARNCFVLAICWAVMILATAVVTIVISAERHEKEELKVSMKILKHSAIMGIIFMLIGFTFNVKL